jgi:glycine cleavage system H protein
MDAKAFREREDHVSLIPEGLQYTKEHEWVSSTGNLYTMGITDFAQGALGDIVYVQLPKVGETLTAGKVCGEIESTKSVSEIFAAISGVVSEINGALSQTPELVNSDPYGAGWLVKVEVAGTPSDLMDAAGYAQITA